MSDFLGRLIARSIQAVEVVRPRPASLFEPLLAPEPLAALETRSPPTGEPEAVVPPQVDPAYFSAVETDPKERTPAPRPTLLGPVAPPLPRVAPELPIALPDTRPAVPRLSAERESPLIATGPVSAPAPNPRLQPRRRVEQAPERASAPVAPTTTPAGPASSPPRLPARPAGVAAPAADPKAQREGIQRRAETQEPSLPAMVRQMVLQPLQREVVRGRTVERMGGEENGAEPAPLPVEPGSGVVPATPLHKVLPQSRQERQRGAPPPSFLTPRVERRPTFAEVPPPGAPPTIRVTIGRVEVRAAASGDATPVRQRPQAAVMSLDEYLAQRAGGDR